MKRKSGLKGPRLNFNVNRNHTKSKSAHKEFNHVTNLQDDQNVLNDSMENDPIPQIKDSFRK